MIATIVILVLLCVALAVICLVQLKAAGDLTVKILNLEAEKLSAESKLDSAAARERIKDTTIEDLRTNLTAERRKTFEYQDKVSDLEKANADLKASVEELQRENERIVKSHNELLKQVPSTKPRAVRWNGPTGARALIEHASQQQAAKGPKRRTMPVIEPETSESEEK